MKVYSVFEMGSAKVRGRRILKFMEERGESIKEQKLIKQKRRKNAYLF
jgi:hypothetical protein